MSTIFALDTRFCLYAKFRFFNRQWMRPLLLFAWLIIHIGCNDSDIRITILPDGLSSDVHFIDVFPQRNQEVEQPAKTVQRDFANFVVKLAAQPGDLLNIRMEGLDGQKCLITSGQSSLTVSEARAYELRIPLTPLAESACILRVEKYGMGGGHVLSSPPGIDCPGTCSALFPPGVKVDLTAFPTPPWYFNGWAGSCSGRDGCSLTIGRKAHRVKFSLVSPPVCSSDDWCWDNPLPIGLQLRGGVIQTNPRLPSWIIGQGGLIMTLMNGALVQVPSGSQANLNAIYPGDRNECDYTSVIVGDGGTILKCSNKQWEPVSWQPPAIPKLTVNNLYGVASGHIVGAGGTIIDGSNCPNQCSLRPKNPLLTMPNLTVDLLATDGRWAVGTYGTIVDISKNPESIVRAPVAGNPTLFAIAGDWIVGAHGTILHYDAATMAWQAVVSGTTKDLYSVFDDFAVGQDGFILQRNGLQWTPIQSGTTQHLRSIVLQQPDRISTYSSIERWAFGDHGTMLHFDGNAWTQLFGSPDTQAGSEEFSAIGGSGVNDVWASGNSLYHWDGIAWKSWNSVQQIPPFSSVWCANELDCYMAAKTGDFYQWNGSLWSLVSTSFKFRNFPGSKHFFGTGPSNVWAATYQGIYHFDGSGWRNETDSPADAVQLFGDTVGDVWAIRTTGEVMYRDTDTWKSLPAFPLKPSIISGIAFSPDDQWLFDSGVVFRPISSVINGMTRVDYVSFQYILGDLRSVWGSSPNKIWAAGYGGMFKYSGASWKPVDIGIPGGGPTSLEAIFGVGPNDIWAVGTQGTILRYRP